MKDLNGLLLVNKDVGLSSHDVVAKARKILGTKEVGHCGTLDPMATGLLVLLVGEATKLSQFILDGHKAYRVGLRLGFETDTLDVTGKIVSAMGAHPEASAPGGSLRPPETEEVQRLGLALQGDFEWSVPAYSAIKVSGEKLYEKARRGEAFVSPLKRMNFWDVSFLGAEALAEGQGLEYSFDLRCSKGSYVRTWVSMLGKNLGFGATMSSLCRTGSDPFSLTDALTLDATREVVIQGRKPSNFIPLRLALPHAKRIRVQGQDQTLIRNGQISYSLRGQLIALFQPGVDEIVQVLDSSSQLLAIVGHEKARGFHIRRVFNCRISGESESLN